MYDIIRTTADRAVRFKDFLLPGVSEMPEFKDSIFFFGYDNETSEIISSAAVFPSLAGARLLSIAVSEKKIAKGFGKKLLLRIVKDLKEIYYDYGEAPLRLTVEDAFDTDAWEDIGGFFERTGFSLKEKHPMMLTRLSDISNSKMLKKAVLRSENGRILPLSHIKREMFREFDEHITKRGLYAGIQVDELEPEISMFYVEDKTILGCVLMSSVSDTEYVNDWVYLDDSVKDRSVILCMLSRCAEEGLEILPPDSEVWFTLLSRDEEQFMQKVVPAFEKKKEIRTYEMLL